MTLLPQAGLSVREEQVKLSHQMLDALLEGNIALCDAGVGIGKTYAYLVACILMRKYVAATGNGWLCDKRPIVISTSSIALQEAIIQEYIPFLSDVFLSAGLIGSPLKAIVRKGKEHFVCDERLGVRLEAVREKPKNELQKKALFSLKQIYDMDEVPNLSSFDRRLVCVPKFCPKECPGRTSCRYQMYLKQARDPDIFFQICNHNYLLADSSHRAKDYKPLLTDYRALIVDEAHKLPEAARQMYGKSLCYEDILEICYFLEREHQGMAAKKLKSVFHNLFHVVRENYMAKGGPASAFHMTEECATVLEEGKALLKELTGKLRGVAPGWIRNQLEEAGEVLSIFSGSGKRYILHLEQDKGKLPQLCATSRKIPDILSGVLWSQGFPAILTSGTLKAGNGFSRTRQENGLGKEVRVTEYARAKNAEFRRAKISDATFDILTFYIEDYKELILKQEYLFINVSGDYAGKPFKVSGVYAMLRRLEEKTGIKASPHMLRHYFANARRKDGWKLELISQALGHRNIETTMKYLNITDEELIEVSDAFYSKHQAMYGIQDLL